MNIVIIMNIVRIQIISIIPKNRGHLYDISDLYISYIYPINLLPIYVY